MSYGGMKGVLFNMDELQFYFFIFNDTEEHSRRIT